jgi:hypothetical protein
MQFTHRLSSRSGSELGFSVIYSVGGWLAPAAAGAASSPSLIAASSSRARFPVADVAASLLSGGCADEG